MQSDNGNGIGGEPSATLGLASQVALQFELLKIAGIRYVAGDPARLQGRPAAHLRPRSLETPPIQRPGETAPSAGPRFSDLVRSRQAPPMAEKPMEKPSVGPLPPKRNQDQEVAETAKEFKVPQPEVSLSKNTGVGLFPLEQSKPVELEELTSEERLEKLEQLRREVAQCVRCPALVSERTQTVFGVGPLDPEICVIGEAPGFNEDRLGEPFVGEAGQLLNKMLAACGFDRSQVFICNILRCRPPGNRTPLPDEAQMCNPFLVRTVELVRPKFICLLGATATRYFLDQSTGVGVLRKRDLQWRGIPVQATYHPAYLLRYPDKKRDAWEDLQRMLARMGKDLPGK